MRFIDTYKEFKKYRLDPSDKLSPGTYHIHELFKQDGKVLSSPDVLLGEDGKDFILETVAAKIQQLQTQFETLEVEDGLKAILLADCTRNLFKYLGKAKVFRNLENTNLPLSSITRQLTDHVVKLQNSPNVLHNIIPWGMRLEHDYNLDFTSRSGRELDKSTNTLTISPHSDSLYGFGNFLVNSIRSSFWKKSNIRIDIYSKDISSEEELVDLNSQILIWCKHTSSEYYIHKHSLIAFLKVIKQKPAKATFNNIGNAMLAGYVSALSQFNIPTVFSSHGAMVVHGDSRRQFITSVLANCVYNYFPGIQSIMPRSSLQAAGAPAKLIKKVRVKSLHNNSNENHTKKSKTEFVVLYAPNFLSWHQCFHGLVPSCFETRKCAEALADICKQLPEIKLNIRLKTTVKDIAKINDANHNRGLLPNDISDLYNNDLGIFDASLGAHTALLEEADLIISEGVTAVLFEALEHRKPLLLLNVNNNRTPSLPATRYSELKKSGQRSAVYQSGTDGTLKEFLLLIQEKHSSVPLTNKELEPYIWVF